MGQAAKRSKQRSPPLLISWFVRGRDHGHLVICTSTTKSAATNEHKGGHTGARRPGNQPWIHLVQLRIKELTSSCL